MNTSTSIAINQSAIERYHEIVLGYCDGLIPLRAFSEQGQSHTAPNVKWIANDQAVVTHLRQFAQQAHQNQQGCFVIPGTVNQSGQAKASEIVQMQTLLVDIDHGDIDAKLNQATELIGPPTLIVESGGITEAGQSKLHAYWQLSEVAEGDDLQLLIQLRHQLALHIGADPHFQRAHQPIRLAGSLYHKSNPPREVRIRECHDIELDLYELRDIIQSIQPASVVSYDVKNPWQHFDNANSPSALTMDEVLKTPIHAGGVDVMSRFDAISMALGYYIRLVHDGQITMTEAWNLIHGYNQAMIRPPWPKERLEQEMNRLWHKHCEKYGQPKQSSTDHQVTTLNYYTFNNLLTDLEGMPEDLIGPRLLTPGGMMVLGGAPKVGKSDFLISLLVYMAAGRSFLGLKAPRPLRIFYLQTEIQYHYLRERLQRLNLPTSIRQDAGDRLVMTPKVNLRLDEKGIHSVVNAVQSAFNEQPPDIICIDPIRNVFDGGPHSGGEIDNDAMLFFVQQRAEYLRDCINPNAGLILCHHTKKVSKQQVHEDPFLSLSGASSLRGFYTAGCLLYKPDESKGERKLTFELRNGPALPDKLIDKVKGEWVELDHHQQRLANQTNGERFDQERHRKRDVIVQLIADQALDGHIYSLNGFAEKFEGKAGLGSKDTIYTRLNTLATKGYIKFFRNAYEYGYPPLARSRYGHLCVEGMQLLMSAKQSTDGPSYQIVSPTHYKHVNGAALEIEDPNIWTYHDGEL